MNYIDKEIEEMPELTVEEWILVLMYSRKDKPIRGKLMLVKQMFLLTKEIVPKLNEKLKFYPYDYGPYSTVLARTLNELIKQKKIIHKIIKEGYLREEFELTEKGREEGKRVFSKVPTEIQDRVINLRKSTDQLGYTGIVRYVYSKYPEYKVFSQIEDMIR